MDPTIVAIPGFFATMGLEHAYLKRKAEREGPTAGTYERDDTITSLAMGVGSLLAPILLPKLLGPIVPGKGRYGRALIATAVGAAAVTTVADRLARLDPDEAPTADGSAPAEPATAPGRERRRRLARAARRIAGSSGVAAVAAAGVAVTTAWASRTTMDRLWKRRVLPDLGTGPLAVAAATFGWDFIYYWNHRFMHTSRYMWAIHVVHHSSEHYNLSTALRQPVADAFGTFVPYSLLALLGFRPDVITTARGLNLLYQYWIHTEVIRTIGPFEEVLNTPSHHRVHHGSNPRYLDRNHGSILIVWDRLFGTFQREEEPVVYGLTKNIETFNLAKVVAHEYVDMAHDVQQSRTWRERLSFVLRGPGWAYEQHALRAADHELTTAA
ncbi:MAG: sterol desaturase family protein [Acidimicrobiales bacterium]